MPAAARKAVVKPTYAVMVTESIKELGDRTGSSVQAISKQLRAKYNIDINKPALIKAIKKGVETGDFVQIKASYKLAKKAPALKKKASTTTTTKPKPAVKSSATKPKKVCFPFFTQLLLFYFLLFACMLTLYLPPQCSFLVTACMHRAPHPRPHPRNR